uniref:Early nodulin-93-like n=1 Tax=Nelumbo nucifera TaxID=4432 RepID=A0A822XPM5_NELNU|nr:TPA_asm: hypothetical protein HUJ06_025027 [Nelumbo nucifera]
MAGVKAAALATIAIAIPTFVSVRRLPWARANLNPTTQALIISIVAVAGSAYFIIPDKTVLATARKNSIKGHTNIEANFYVRIPDMNRLLESLCFSLLPFCLE